MLVRILLIVGVLIGIGAWIWKIAPNSSRLELIRSGIHFPTVSGHNLERQEFEFPRDFEAELNLVIVPFKQYQQNSVNTWIPTAQEIEANSPNFIYYELPTIYEMPVLSRTFINEGMRAGIPDQTARMRTVTLYLNKEQFKSALGITSEDTIYLFIINQDGDILWQTEGEFSPEKAAELMEFIQNYDGN